MRPAEKKSVRCLVPRTSILRTDNVNMEQDHERIRIPVPRWSTRQIPGADAADDAEMDDLDEGSWGQRPYQGPRPAARTCRQTGARQAEDRNGRTICRGKGRRRRLHADRSPRSERSRGAIQGLPDLRSGGCCRSSAGHEVEHVMEPSDYLFRREAGRMVATLTRVFGVHNLALAEDVVQDAFCRAMEVWKFRGLPENPAAWLMAVAKNRALDVLRRERTARTFAPELTRRLESEWTLVPTLDEQFAPHAIKDDLLRMMFSCCDSLLREESQVALVLHILCGFSVDEVAGAFVSTHVAIEKRLARAKKVLAQLARLFDIADAAEFGSRLPAVQRTLYLLFNEGYHGASPQFAV